MQVSKILKHPLFPIISAALSGLIFGVGLLLSGMTNPAKVLAFLDLGGAWDPSLALVMAGGIGFAFWPFRLAKKRPVTFLHLPTTLPVSTAIDRRLLGGSLLFGIGWGIAGLCPGPALVVLSAGSLKGFAFVAAMIAGMLLFEVLEN
ncbi:MAG: YeeE/YedE family protein [Burkholderiaceae bacterium]|nr:YeeE/YedE family protein [Burkholderiaceae bacterium]